MALERHELRHRDGRRLFVYGELRGSLAGETDAGAAAAEPDGHAALQQRLDRLTDAWVAISPARNTRPNTPPAGTTDGPACPFCPGGPEVPFAYDAAAFENRFPSLVADPPPVAGDPRLHPALGRCEVVLYTERHEGSIATLTAAELANLLAIWRDRSAELWADLNHRHVLIFENRGAAVGATLSHPHGQIYAFDHLPPLIAARRDALAKARAASGRCLGCDVVAEDDADARRRVVASDGWTVAVPFAARFPYEIHVRARRHGARRLTDLADGELRALAGALRELVLRYDALFGVELPYMMTILEAPADTPDWHLAVEFAPLHRSERLMKIRASVETASGLFINDTLPESSAASLRSADVAPARAESPVPPVVASPTR
jgi:UDPglucose--hexose-1-phosphate uridylyltransferase